MTTIYPVIMCGGAGTRLWPLSTQARPKQYHALTSEQSMLTETVLRVSVSAPELAGVTIAAPSFICSDAHVDVIDAQCEAAGLSPLYKILEPMGRNTAAVGAAAAQVFGAQDDAVILLLPADHHIADIDGFWHNIRLGLAGARDGYLVTLGIAPTHSETGYGYIRKGAGLGDHLDHVAEFKEKPDAVTAQAYLDSGEYFWNAGIFLFSPAAMTAAFSAHARDIYNSVQAALPKAADARNHFALNAEAFSACRSESIDIAIMEQFEKVAIVSPVDIGWNDIGSWSALRDARPGEHGDVIALDCNNSYIRSDGPLVTAVGLDNMIVVASEGKILIMPADRAQDVKAIVGRLKADKRTDQL